MTWGPGTKVLVLGGGTSHDFQKSFNETDLTTMKEAKGTYTLHYTESVAAAVAELPKVDVFITSTNQDEFDDEPMRKALFDFIAAKKGAIFIHPSTWYNYREWPEYNQELIGGGSVGHDAFREFEVQVNQSKHPVMEGVPSSFRVSDELYTITIDSAHGMPIEVLATGITPDNPNATYPSVWVVKHPKSRIVCIALGHDEEAHQHAAFKTILRNALAWVSSE